MRYDTRTIGAIIAVVGLFLLLTLRLWASPVARTITGRESVNVVAFLGIPTLLVVFGIGVVLFLWSEELGLA